MIDRDTLKAMRERAAIQNSSPLHKELCADVITLLDELDRVRKLHTEEQRRSADRLREIKDWLKDALSRNQIVHEIDRTQAREFVERNPNES